MRVSLEKWDPMDFVKLSANWAPLSTHLSIVPSLSDSFIDLIINWTRNSEQLGGAVLVIAVCDRNVIF